jgi:hypothetical protein
MLKPRSKAFASLSVLAVVQITMSMPRISHLVVIDLGENDLFLQAHGIVAATVEAGAGNAAEIADTRQRDRDQAVQEFVHPPAAQRDLAADADFLAQLELRDRLAGLGDDRLLAGNRLQLS